jgi:hypothetical protein
MLVLRVEDPEMNMYDYLVRTNKEKFDYVNTEGAIVTVEFLSANALKTLVVENAEVDVETLPPTLEHLEVICHKQHNVRAELPERLVNLKTLILSVYSDYENTYEVPKHCTSLRHISTNSVSINLYVHKDVLRGITSLRIDEVDEYEDREQMDGYVLVKDIPREEEAPNLTELRLSYSLPPVTEVNKKITHLTITDLEYRDVSEFVAKFPSLEHLVVEACRTRLILNAVSNPCLRRLDINGIYGGLELCGELTNNVELYYDGKLEPRYSCW